MAGSYYSKRLAAERLRSCYELAPPRVRQYLAAEVRHAGGRIGATHTVLELGCGYGRVMEALAGQAARIVGIDTSEPSLQLGSACLRSVDNCSLARMDALALAFADQAFDVVLCIQNGISAFGVDRLALMRESLRVTRPGGRVLFSSYSERFWEHRLEWFRRQSEHGLLGEIDSRATGNGVVVCKDGFRATTVGPAEFRVLAAELDVRPHIEEVDGSSVFCEIRVS